MEFRRLGNSGIKFSALAYGNWITHGGQVEHDTAIACVHAALDVGITTFDTANVYHRGRAEEVLGEALRGLNRDSYELCTKVYWPMGDGVNQRGLSRRHITRSLEDSLRRLGVETVDLYQAHRFDFETPLEETMSAFADLVHRGLVHYIGVSEWTADQIRAGCALARELHVPLVSSQPQYSMLWRVIESEVIPTCEAEGLSQIVWSPLAQGILTGKYLPGAALPAASRATDDLGGGAAFIRRFLRDEVLAAVAQLVPIAHEQGVTLAQMAIAWVLRNDNVTSAILGASRPEQLRENVKALDVELDTDTLTRIDAILRAVLVDDPGLTTSPQPRA